MKPLPIRGLQKTSLIDYPGKIAATIFLGGCNLRCNYCYNKELVFPTKEKSIPEQEVLAFLRKRKNVLDGVCITGGEPTIHQELPMFLKKIKDNNYKIKLDTNGTNPEMVAMLIKHHLIDYLAMDIKASEETYQRVTSVQADMKKIKQTVQLLKNSHTHYELRMTIIPSITTMKEIKNVAQWTKGCTQFYLQQFKPTDKIMDTSILQYKPHPEREIKKFKKELAKTIPKVEIRWT